MHALPGAARVGHVRALLLEVVDAEYGRVENVGVRDVRHHERCVHPLPPRCGQSAGPGPAGRDVLPRACRQLRGTARAVAALAEGAEASFETRGGEAP
eukprot:2329444-Lingulodinium_polyedra.AAC.1